MNTLCEIVVGDRWKKRADDLKIKRLANKEFSEEVERLKKDMLRTLLNNGAQYANAIAPYTSSLKSDKEEGGDSIDDLDPTDQRELVSSLGFLEHLRRLHLKMHKDAGVCILPNRENDVINVLNNQHQDKLEQLTMASRLIEGMFNQLVNVANWFTVNYQRLLWFCAVRFVLVLVVLFLPPPYQWLNQFLALVLMLSFLFEAIGFGLGQFFLSSMRLTPKSNKAYEHHQQPVAAEDTMSSLRYAKMSSSRSGGGGGGRKVSSGIRHS